VPHLGAFSTEKFSFGVKIILGLKVGRVVCGFGVVKGGVLWVVVEVVDDGVDNFNVVAGLLVVLATVDVVTTIVLAVTVVVVDSGLTV